MAGEPASFGIYLHIPFCESRCDYCAFATWTDRDHLIADYLAAARRDLERWVAELDRPASCVFVGGGTPSRVPASDLAAVLVRLELTDDAEVTIECNPDSVDVESANVYARAGINRVSLGVQSMVPSVLATLGRTHDPAAVHRAVGAVRDAGIERLNVDLIYGTTGESARDWERTVEEAIALEPDHVSAYALTVEPGTPLADDVDRHPDDDDQADKYVIADDRLTAAGLANYEISHWASPGCECRQNLLYWRQGDYIGIGCAAHSHIGGRRWWNVRTPERYIELVMSGRSAMAGHEQLTDVEREAERLQLAVRTLDGVPIAAVPDAVRHLVDEHDGVAILTRAGRLLASEVAVRLRS